MWRTRELALEFFQPCVTYEPHLAPFAAQVRLEFEQPRRY